MKSKELARRSRDREGRSCHATPLTARRKGEIKFRYRAEPRHRSNQSNNGNNDIDRHDTHLVLSFWGLIITITLSNTYNGLCMIQKLANTFIKNSDDVKNPSVRSAYGHFSGIVGIICNLVLFFGKLAAGLISGSIAILADAINSVSDAASNIVALVGFKLAAMPPDAKHPYGYARYEYIAGLAVSAIIVAVGLSLGKESIMKIIHPDSTTMSTLTVIILVVSILVKLWMSHFYKVIGKKIDSDTLIATSTDSRNDILSTGAVLISLIISHFTEIAFIDGIMGVLVAAFIIYSGIGLIRETLSPILGESPEPELVEQVEKKVLSYDHVLGIHDLMIHDYGPGHQFASLHIEMPAELDPLISHDIIDNIENDFYTNDHLHVSIHYDPIVTSDTNVTETKEKLKSMLESYDKALSFHDFRMVPGDTHTNVLFDLVIPARYQGDKEKLIKDIGDLVRQIDAKNIPKIKVEHSFSGEDNTSDES